MGWLVILEVAKLKTLCVARLLLRDIKLDRCPWQGIIGLICHWKLVFDRVNCSSDCKVNCDLVGEHTFIFVSYQIFTGIHWLAQFLPISLADSCRLSWVSYWAVEILSYSFQGRCFIIFCEVRNSIRCFDFFLSVLSTAVRWLWIGLSQLFPQLQSEEPMLNFQSAL